MCGVLATTDSVVFPTQYSRSALADITPRGPDAEGLCVAGGMSFGRTRRAIIWFGTAGAPPYGDQERGLLVHNGEIHNCKEFATALSIHPTRMRTYSTRSWRGDAPTYSSYSVACTRSRTGILATTP